MNKDKGPQNYSCGPFVDLTWLRLLLYSVASGPIILRHYRAHPVNSRDGQLNSQHAIVYKQYFGPRFHSGFILRMHKYCVKPLFISSEFHSKPEDNDS